MWTVQECHQREGGRKGELRSTKKQEGELVFQPLLAKVETRRRGVHRGTEPLGEVTVAFGKEGERKGQMLLLSF